MTTKVPTLCHRWKKGILLLEKDGDESCFAFRTVEPVLNRLPCNEQYPLFLRFSLCAEETAIPATEVCNLPVEFPAAVF